jgi:SAM-dependent methyltransferase
VEKTWAFDIPWALEFAEVRKKFLVSFLQASRSQMELASALDVGCGVGEFSQFLFDSGLRVVAVDGRPENVAEGQRRCPQVTFRTANAEDLTTAEIGIFDLVICFGLLYHLENPFRAIRNLHSLTQKVLIVESMCSPDSQPTMDLLDEYVTENQGLNYVAFYPSESCLVKMLYRAGFPFVYGLVKPLEHELFHESIWQKKRRTILVASKVQLAWGELRPISETIRPWDIWSTTWQRLRSRSGRLGSLVGKLLPRFPGVRQNSRKVSS